MGGWEGGWVGGWCMGRLFYSFCTTTWYAVFSAPCGSPALPCAPQSSAVAQACQAGSTPQPSGSLPKERGRCPTRRARAWEGALPRNSGSIAGKEGDHKNLALTAVLLHCWVCGWIEWIGGLVSRYLSLQRGRVVSKQNRKHEQESERR